MPATTILIGAAALLFAAAARFNQVIVRLIERVANATQRPRWKPGSFFRRFASPAPKPVLSLN